nr:hypothetical protein [Nocardia abscessus]
MSPRPFGVKQSPSRPATALSLALSLPLGAGRLTQTFLTGDPPSRQEFEQLRRHIRDL